MSWVNGMTCPPHSRSAPILRCGRPRKAEMKSAETQMSGRVCGCKDGDDGTGQDGT